MAKRFTEGLKDTLELVLPVDRGSWYKYIALLPREIDREWFKTQMRERGVSLSGGVYDLPLHLQPVFENLNLAGTLPGAEDLCGRHICLPIFYGMTDQQVDHVIACVNELVSGQAPAN